MEKLQQQQPEATVEHKKGNPPKFKNALDRISRRERRVDNRQKYNNDRSPKNSGSFSMGVNWDGSAIYHPKRGKMKGWMKELKKQKTHR